MSNHENQPSRKNLRPRDEQRIQAAGDIVRSFLQAIERRDLAAAQDYLAPGFTMTFPGNVQFSSLKELVVWGRQRYQSIGKTYSRFDAMSDGEEMVVYCFGTLHGTLPNGSDFQDIRFVDRFTLRNNKLVDQRVWNDMGELLGSA